MDLVTLVTACALTVDPKLMHALIWHSSGGEPWAISVQSETNPRVYPDMRDAIREAHSDAFMALCASVLPALPYHCSTSRLPFCDRAATPRWRRNTSPDSLGLRLWLIGIVLWTTGHFAAVWATKRDTQFVDVVRRHLR